MIQKFVVVKKQHIYDMSVPETRMLRWMSRNTRIGKIKKSSVQRQEAPIEEKIKGSCLTCFGHMQWRAINIYILISRRAINILMRNSYLTQIEGIKRDKRKSKMTGK